MENSPAPLAQVAELVDAHGSGVCGAITAVRMGTDETKGFEGFRNFVF
jgi:hypothetical protein